MSADTIEEVIQQLDSIIASAISSQSPLGYFPSLYRQVTREVDARTRQGGFFDDDQRMRKMVVIFANRYLDAHEAWKSGKPLTQSWVIPFDTTLRRNKLVLQHLVLGINAHINLDLGIAAATVAPGEQLKTFQADFDRINVILFGLIDTMQSRMEKISPWIGMLDRWLKNKEDLFIRWSMGKARDAAWEFAQKLAAEPGTWPERIKVRDVEVELLAKVLAGPGWFAGFIIWIIRRWESRDVDKNIRILEGEAAS